MATNAASGRFHTRSLKPGYLGELRGEKEEEERNKESDVFEEGGTYFYVLSFNISSSVAPGVSRLNYTTRWVVFKRGSDI